MVKMVVMKKVGTMVIILTFIGSGVILVLLPSPLIFPATAASNWTTTTDGEFGNGTFNNTTVEGTGGNALVQIDMSGTDHWTNLTLATNPGSRWGHGMATIYGTTQVILYGGWSVTNTLAYNISNNTWIDKKPTNSPGGKQSHGMASFYGTDKVLIFSDYYRSHDTWMYDFSENNWIKKDPFSKPLGRRCCAMSAVFNDDKVVMFGGQNVVPNDYTWIYDLSGDDWTRKTTTNYPSRRIEHAMAPILGTDKVLLFGGTNFQYSPTYNDTWIYDVSDNTWTQMYPNTSPPPTQAHAMAPIWGSDKIVISAGRPSGTSVTDQTWVYDYSDNDWKEIKPWNPSNTPGARADHAMAFIDGSDNAVAFGGFGTDADTNTWIYKQFLSLKNGTYVSAPYDTGANSSFNSISWSADVPTDTTLKFQLRTGINKTEMKSKPFIGPDGSTTTFYTSSPENIWSGHYGDRWVQYKGYFNMDVFTDSPTIKNVVISYNCLPCCRIIDPFDGCLVSNNKPTFKWCFEDFDAEKQKAFILLIDDDINFTDVDFNSSEQITEDQFWEFPTGTSYSELPDGTWYWKLRVKDHDDTWSEFSKPHQLRIDTQAPSSATTFPINNGFYRKVDEITGIAIEGVTFSGMAKVEISIRRLIDNYFWTGNSWIPLTTWLTVNGTANWTYDSTAVQWTSGLRYGVQCRAIDLAINIEVPEIENIFIIDTDNPESSISYPIDHTWVNQLKAISGTAVDIGGSGIDKVEICIKCSKDSVAWDEGAKENEYWNGNAWTSSETWLVALGTNEWSYNASDIPFTTSDHYVIHSHAVDRTTNIELAGSGTTFMYDAKPPDPISVFINNGEEFTALRWITLSLTAMDVGSGVAKMAFSPEGILWSMWEPFNNTWTYELQSGDGEKIIYFRVQDYAGNIAEPVLDKITLDTTPPHDLSISINDGAEYSGSKHVKVACRATDLGSGVAEMAYSFDANSWSTWEPFASERTLTLSPIDGEKVVHYRARDRVGNTADPVSDSIILDTSPPHSLSVEINHGAAEANSTSVTLNLNAIDDISGVSEMAFSLDGDSWTEWEPFASERVFTLPPTNGEQTVYFKVNDKLGNEAIPEAATIIMNITTVEPDVEVVKTPAGDDFWNYILIIIVVFIVLILIIIALAMVIRKKRRRESISGEAVTIKPQEFTPVPTSKQVSGPAQYPQLACIPTVSTAQTPTPTIATTSTPVPMLAKSTTTAQPTIAQAPPPTVVTQPVPQLPPATTPTPTPTVATPAPQPTIAPQPTLAVSPSTQPQSTPTAAPPIANSTPTPSLAITSTPTLAQPPEPSQRPVVHLPDSTTSTTQLQEEINTSKESNENELRQEKKENNI
ncbi:Kelch repeat-containing protein [[Eubacterium] cellulosolvens]